MSMTLNAADISRVHDLARRLEQDIQWRGLGAGDAYLTAEAAGKMLDVSRMTANRAMNILARRKVLVRYRSRGTFVGPALRKQSPSAARTIHYITFVDDTLEIHLAVGAMLAGLRTAIPTANLQNHCLPLDGAMACVEREVEAARTDPSFGGFVLSLGPRQIQECLARSGLPTVVHGSLFSGVSLPCVESDQEGVGRIMVRQALKAGHRRMVWINRERWRRGDELAFDGMIDEARSAGLEIGAVSVRNTPIDLGAMAAAMHDWIEEFEPPVALLCRERRSARAALQIAEQRRLRIPQDVFVIYDDTGTSDGTEPLPKSAAIRCEMRLKDEYAVIGRMLAQMAANRSAVPKNVLLPVVPCPG
jgi:DNA-binding LacI/PurR family transcriptional regulator